MNNFTKANRLKRLFICAICMVLICLTINCSNQSSAYKTDSSQAQFQKLYGQIRTGQYSEIYRESSQEIQNGISEEAFINRKKVAVGKMKDVDENLDFQKSETSDDQSRQCA